MWNLQFGMSFFIETLDNVHAYVDNLIRNLHFYNYSMELKYGNHN